jgi:ADP-glucose pyrophosphorylase
MEFKQKPLSLLSSWIGTRQTSLPPPKVDNSSHIKRTILGSGDIISPQNDIIDSVLGQGIVTGERCTLDHCVLLGADTDNCSDARIELSHKVGDGDKRQNDSMTRLLLCLSETKLNVRMMRLC